MNTAGNIVIPAKSSFRVSPGEERRSLEVGGIGRMGVVTSGRSNMRESGINDGTLSRVWSWGQTSIVGSRTHTIGLGEPRSKQ